MTRHVELAIDDAQDLAVCSNHKSCALVRQESESPDAEDLGDLAIGVRQKREAEIVLFVEGFLPIHRIGADPYALGTEFLELARQIAKVTTFDRSTRGHRLRIEEEDEWPAF